LGLNLLQAVTQAQLPPLIIIIIIIIKLPDQAIASTPRLVCAVLTSGRTTRNIAATKASFDVCAAAVELHHAMIGYSL
jgi:hypothetical protein